MSIELQIYFGCIRCGGKRVYLPPVQTICSDLVCEVDGQAKEGKAGDRVWCLDPSAPRDIRFHAATLEETLCCGLFPIVAQHKLSFGTIASTTEVWMKEVDRLYSSASALGVIEDECASRLESAICAPIAKRIGRAAPAFTGSETVLTQHLGVGSTQQVLSLVFESIPIIDEAELDWGQVREMRADEECTTKIRRLLHWIDSERQNQSPDYIRDRIHVLIGRIHRCSPKARRGNKPWLHGSRSRLESDFRVGGSGYHGVHK